MIKLTPTHYWRIGLGVSLFICIVMLLLVGFSGKSETQGAFEGGQRLLITLETGIIEGKQAPTEKPPEADAEDKKPEAEERKAEVPLETPADAASMPSVSPDKAPDASAPAEAASAPAVEPEKKPEAEAVQAAPVEPVSTAAVAPSTPAVESPKPDTVKTPTAPLAGVNEALIEPSKSAKDELLPKIGADGIKPWRYYARHYAHKGHLPTIAVIVTGLGENKSATDMAMKLPANFSLSFSPYAKDLGIWINAARAAGHEALIDLPLEPGNFPAADPGPYGLLVGKGNDVNGTRLEWVMSRGQAYVGFLTPQNEVFTADAEGAKLLLDTAGKRGLMLVMGHEPGKTETGDLLNASQTAHATGDVLIDEELSATAIQARLLTLQKLAAKRGYAVGIAQAYPLTIQQLSAWVDQGAKDGFEVVPISFVVGLKFPN